MALAIEQLETPSPAQLPLEIVERKGLGHPETKAGPLGRLAIDTPGPTTAPTASPTKTKYLGTPTGV
jgi:hypothetical protein